MKNKKGYRLIGRLPFEKSVILADCETQEELIAIGMEYLEVFPSILLIEKPITLLSAKKAQAISKIIGALISPVQILFSTLIKQ